MGTREACPWHPCVGGAAPDSNKLNKKAAYFPETGRWPGIGGSWSLCRSSSAQSPQRWLLPTWYHWLASTCGLRRPNWGGGDRSHITEVSPSLHLGKEQGPGEGRLWGNGLTFIKHDAMGGPLDSGRRAVAPGSALRSPHVARSSLRLQATPPPHGARRTSQLLRWAQCRFLMAQTPEAPEPWVGLVTSTDTDHPVSLALK